MTRIGRPPTCDCGECRKCKHRDYMRRWYQQKSLDERREHIAKRDPVKVLENERRRYERDREKRNALSSAWAKRNRAAINERNRRIREEQSHKYSAWLQMSEAIRVGLLIRKACEVCGNAKTDGHHDDYSKPLDVRWLCRKHHAQQHRKVA